MMNKTLTFLAALCTAACAFAEDEFNPSEVDVPREATPVQVSLATPLQLPTHDRDVRGLRWDILWGRSLSVWGVDFGLVGTTTRQGDLRGLQLAGFSYDDGDMLGAQFGVLANCVARDAYGLQVAGVLNWNRSDDAAAVGLQLALLNFNSGFRGLDLGLLNWGTGTFCGIGLGAVNVQRETYTGGALALVNYFEGDLVGAQVGLINLVQGKSTGLQLGVINASNSHLGVQVGLLNMNVSSALPIFPVVNANF